MENINSATEAKNAKIAEAIRIQFAVTGNIQSAIDMVLGFGTSKTLIDQLYNELRAKALKN